MHVALLEIKKKKLSLLQGSILQGIAATFFTWYSVTVLLSFNHFFAFIKYPKGFVWFGKKKKKACANVTYILPGGIYKGQGK